MSPGKRVADAIHGTIPLSDVEVDLIDTRAFQRLRNIKHLGLAHYVFPGANFSRLSHSLGVCHVTGRILDALEDTDHILNEERKQRYRLAGLLHDIGHYPLSHVYEHAVSDVVSTRQFSPRSGDDSRDGEPTEPPEPHLKHERVSALILTEDEEVNAVLERHDIDAEAISRTFMGQEDPPKYQRLITSDLDADRIDYLMRTAHHTGLPYGQVDLDYLLAQIQVDGDGEVCLHPKALHTAEHFLLGRYFDRQSVAFHKTVFAFEWILSEVVKLLIKQEILPGYPEAIREMIASGEWHLFDDVYAFDRIRRFAADAQSGSPGKVMADALLERSPPRLIDHYERLAPRTPNERRDVTVWTAAAKRAAETVAAEYGINPELFNVTEGPNILLTKVGAHIELGATADDLLEEEARESVKILQPDGSSQPVTKDLSSLMHLLSDRALYRSRAYVLLPPDRAEEREAIEGRWAEIMDEVGW